ncbi:MAG: MiaB/RimO family radical SAM methylthiotransferase, partial [Nitrospirae bacterium]|nr:MiaB/RimO family radical SAM methylthiotransferase [Nitrospirota bacterium]
MANKFSLVSLGCPKNLVDSDNLTERLVNSGLSYLDNPENTDILLINTCGFIQDAKKESIAEILKLAEIKKRTHVSVTVNSDSVGKKLTLKPDTDTNLPSQTHEHHPKLIVFGCLAKRYKNDLIKEIPDIDAIFGVGEEEKIVEYCEKIQVPSVSVSVNSVSVGKKLTLKTDTDTNLTPSPIHPFSSYAYLKIAEGCSRKCTYCVIPSIRGEYKSITPDEILKKAEGYINAGIKELILIAQDTASYGKGLKGYDIAALLKGLCSIKGDFWIRLLYAYPASIKDPLLKVIAGEEKICKYLDIPFQHSEDRILKLMKRGGSRKGYLNLIRKIRHTIPDIALRTTFIAGFPSETEEEFNSLIKFIEEAEFDRLGAFKYSKEEGTPAAKLKEHLTEAIKNRRFDTIMRHQ